MSDSEWERPRAGAKAVTWNWEFLNEKYSDIAKCYTLTEKQVAFLSQALVQAQWSTRWFNRPPNFDTVLQFVIDADIALYSPVRCVPDETIPDDNESEECEMGCKLPIVTIGGIPYLVEDCGCGEQRFYQLSNAPIGTDGFPIPATTGGQVDPAFDQYIVPVSEASCYQEQATEYLLGRARAFTKAVASYSSTGLQAFSAFDEIFEIGLIIASIVFGNEFNDIEDLSEIFVDNAFNNTDFNTLMTAGWNANLTSVSKADLHAWRQSSPNIVGGLPMRSQLGSWINYLDMNAINAQLAQIRASCASGNALVPPISFLYDWVYEWDFTINSQGTPTGTGGWQSDDGTKATYLAGAGWGKGASGDDFACVVKHTGMAGRAITGIQWFLDAPMGGNNNLIFVARDAAAALLNESGHPENPITREIVGLGTITTKLRVGIAEFVFTGTPGDELTKRIQRLRIFGTGTPPPDGVNVT